MLKSALKNVCTVVMLAVNWQIGSALVLGVFELVRQRVASSHGCRNAMIFLSERF
jgi:hypothetical protein